MIVFSITGKARTDYYDGALFTLDQSTHRLEVPKQFSSTSTHHSWDKLLADALFQVNADGKTVRITAEVVDEL